MSSPTLRIDLFGTTRSQSLLYFKTISFVLHERISGALIHREDQRHIFYITRIVYVMTGTTDKIKAGILKLTEFISVHSSYTDGRTAFTSDGKRNIPLTVYRDNVLVVVSSLDSISQWAVTASFHYLSFVFAIISSWTATFGDGSCNTPRQKSCTSLLRPTTCTELYEPFLCAYLCAVQKKTGAKTFFREKPLENNGLNTLGIYRRRGKAAIWLWWRTATLNVPKRYWL